MACRLAWTYARRDRRLPLRTRFMARTAIHPGEQLRDELNELGITPTSLEVIITSYLTEDTPRGAYDGFRSAAGRAISASR